jgi:hypothetical protein
MRAFPWHALLTSTVPVSRQRPAVMEGLSEVTDGSGRPADRCRSLTSGGCGGACATTQNVDRFCTVTNVRRYLRAGTAVMVVLGLVGCSIVRPGPDPNRYLQNLDVFFGEALQWNLARYSATA